MWYAAQLTPQVDAEIAKKGHFWMETSELLCDAGYRMARVP